MANESALECVDGLIEIIAVDRRLCWCCVHSTAMCRVSIGVWREIWWRDLNSYVEA